MMDRVVFDNRRHTVEIMQAAGGFCIPTSISREVDGKLVGGVVFDHYHPNSSIEMHVAGFRENWLSRDLLQAVFDYPFKALGVERIFGRVPEKNRALAFDLKFGAEQVARIQGVFPDDDQIILRLERDNCRFLNVKREA